MRFSNQQYVQALYETLAETSPKGYDRVIENFVRILHANNDLHRYEALIAAYEKLDRGQRGAKEVEVTAVKESEINSHLVHQLNRIAGEKLEIRKKVDESLVGGVVIKVDDT